MSADAMATVAPPNSAEADANAEPFTVDDLSTATAVACKTCGQVHAVVALRRGEVAKCIRCGATLHRRTRLGLAGTAAFTLCAILLYVPAYTFPILDLELYGTNTETTVFTGIKLFYRDQQYIMAVVVLMASVIIPVLKLLGLMYLTVSTALGWQRAAKLRTRIYEAIELIGRYAMLDVFALSIWVAVVKVQKLASIHPGPGLLPFGCVVVFTLMATACFDPQSIWDQTKGTAS